MVIDDEPDIVFALQELFEFEGYRVVTATQGKQGLQRLDESQPQLVLLDLMMPVMNGWEVLEALAARPDRDKLRVIVMSASSGVEAAAKFGCDFMKKPIETSELLALAARLTNEAQ